MGIICVVVIVLCIALVFFLWHIKGLRGERNFSIYIESLGEQSEKIRELLTSMKVSPREVNYTILLLEEILVRLEGRVDSALTVRVHRFFGDVNISLSARGDAFNPFESLESWNPESEDYLRDLIFRAHKEDLSYCRKNDRNEVIIRAHHASAHAMYITSATMIAGIAVGFGMKWLPGGVSTFIADNILSTVQSMFLNGISLMIAPVMFFSLSTSLSHISGGNEIGRIGGKVMGSFVMTMVTAILISFGIAYLFFSGDVPPLPETHSSLPEGLQGSNKVSVSSLVLSVIPSNLVSPMLEGNMLQILFVAILTGLSLSALGDKTASLRSLFEEANALFLKMMEMIISFMPLVVFVSMALFVFSCDAATLAVLAKYLIGFIIGGATLYVLYMVVVLVVGHISPITYFRKTCPYLLNPLMTSSSTACIPMSIDLCKKKLGVSNKIASFTIPLGASVSMNGNTFCVVLTVVLLARMCGGNLDFGACVRLGVMTLLLGIGHPIMVIATLLVANGIPFAALGFVVGIWDIIDRLMAVFNVNASLFTSLIVSKSEGELDMAIYKGSNQA